MGSIRTVPVQRHARLLHLNRHTRPTRLMTRSSGRRRTRTATSPHCGHRTGSLEPMTATTPELLFGDIAAGTVKTAVRFHERAERFVIRRVFGNSRVHSVGAVRAGVRAFMVDETPTAVTARGKMGKVDDTIEDSVYFFSSICVVSLRNIGSSRFAALASSHGKVTSMRSASSSTSMVPAAVWPSARR